jgi:hypothetical protein
MLLLHCQLLETTLLKLLIPGLSMYAAAHTMLQLHLMRH